MTEQIETERESILEGQLIPAGSSERVFSTLSELTDYMRSFNIENGRFLTGNMDGCKVHVLVYQPVNQ